MNYETDKAESVSIAEAIAQFEEYRRQRMSSLDRVWETEEESTLRKLREL